MNSSKKYVEGLKFVRDNLTEKDLYLQMAEEAAELAQSCAKMVRVVEGSNPTPVTEEEAKASVREELSDVLLCNAVMQLAHTDGSFNSTMASKLERWVNRIKES